jgi:hypothetical protein
MTDIDNIHRHLGSVDGLNEDYYILSLKWSRGEVKGSNLVWWAPDDKGYTARLDRAGKYKGRQILEHFGYYNNGIDTRAIRCDTVDRWAIRVVLRDNIDVMRDLGMPLAEPEKAEA